MLIPALVEPIATLELPSVEPVQDGIELPDIGAVISGLTPALLISVEPSGIVPPLRVKLEFASIGASGEAVPVALAVPPGELDDAQAEAMVEDRRHRRSSSCPTSTSRRIRSRRPHLKTFLNMRSRSCCKLNPARGLVRLGQLQLRPVECLCRYLIQRTCSSRPCQGERSTPFPECPSRSAHGLHRSRRGLQLL